MHEMPVKLSFIPYTCFNFDPRTVELPGVAQLQIPVHIRPASMRVSGKGNVGRRWLMMRMLWGFWFSRASLFMPPAPSAAHGGASPRRLFLGCRQLRASRPSTRPSAARRSWRSQSRFGKFGLESMPTHPCNCATLNLLCRQLAGNNGKLTSINRGYHGND